MTEQTIPATEAVSAMDFLLRLIDRFWRAIMQPWLPWLCAGLLMLLVIAAMLLPQLPAQLSEDPASSARWLSTISSDYVWVGGALAGLGLFNAMNSLFWRFLSVVLALLLLLHLLHLWLLDRQMAAAGKALASPDGSGTEPLALPANPAPCAARFVAGMPPLDAYEKLVARLKLDYTEVRNWQSVASETPSESEPPGSRFRALALRGQMALRLRMLLLLGGILASGVLWNINVAGWRIQTAALAPLERFRDDWRNVAVDFAVKDGIPTLVVQQGEIRTELPVTATTTSQGSGSVTAFAGPPTLLIQSLSPDAELKRPDGASSNAAGLLFSSPGSEETLLLPQQETVLRIVRRTDAAPLNFTIEAIQAGIDETTRFEVENDEKHTIKLGTSEVTLRFLPLYSRTVEVISLPRLGWLWLAGVLTLIGCVGLRQRPGFALVQVASWPVDRAVVVVQANEEEGVEAVRQTLASS